MIVLHAVGDVAPDRPQPADCFALARETLQRADIGFCQLECNLTTRGARLPQVRHSHRSVPETADAMREAGFDVASIAGNHCMDWGTEGLTDTIENLEKANLGVVGAGLNIDAARKPVIIERDGVRTAFLAYSSILPEGYWAQERRAGCAPMRAHTHYEQIEPDQPGTPPRVHTWAFRKDLENLAQDVTEVRRSADAVVVSLHWGIHFVPAVLADYQREVARAAIDAGADLILGHHAHILKGIEFYKNRGIVYSLANFAIDLRMTPEHAARKSFKEIQALSPDWEPDFDSLYNFPPDSRKTMILRAEIGKGGVAGLAFYPAMINNNAQPEVLAPDDPRFMEVVDYLQWCCEEQNLNARFETDGDRVSITEEQAVRAKMTIAT
jgi:poly-gamma-glutamate synthesis protein (capsule biosynthesis protein)